MGLKLIKATKKFPVDYIRLYDIKMVIIGNFFFFVQKRRRGVKPLHLTANVHKWIEKLFFSSLFLCMCLSVVNKRIVLQLEESCEPVSIFELRAIHEFIVVCPLQTHKLMAICESKLISLQRIVPWRNARKDNTHHSWFTSKMSIKKSPKNNHENPTTKFKEKN